MNLEACMTTDPPDATAAWQNEDSHVPLCAWCKKARDAFGCWHVIDSEGVRDSQAGITHGICPDCLKQLIG